MFGGVRCRERAWFCNVSITQVCGRCARTRNRVTELEARNERVQGIGHKNEKTKKKKKKQGRRERGAGLNGLA